MPHSLFLSVLYQVLIVSLSHLLFPGHPLLMLYRMLKGRGGEGEGGRGGRGREGGREGEGREREGGEGEGGRGREGEGGREGKKEIIHFKVKKACQIDN